MNENIRQSTQSRPVPSPLYFAAFITAFLAALTYFLGRAYLNAYYSHFGVAPGALLFSTYDYMFSSVPILLMVIGFIPGILLTYYALVAWRPFGVDTSKRWKDRWPDIIFIFTFTIIFSQIIYTFFASKPPFSIPFHLPYFLGFIVGFSIGMVFFPTFWLLIFIFGASSGKDKVKRLSGIYTMFILIVFFFSMTPFLANKMAQSIALTDLDRLPVVTVAITKWPTELWDAADMENKYINAKLLTINNGWAYFFDVPTDNSTGKLYSMQISDIDYIVYSGSQK